MFFKLFIQIKKHKIISGLIFLILVGGSYWSYEKIFHNSQSVSYLTAPVKRGTLVISVNGSGQVSASNQIEEKSKVAGEVIYLGVKGGQEVKAGTLLVQLDATEAQKAVRDAETNLESAKLALEKLKKPADTLSLLQAENALAQAKESKENAETELKKAYDDGFNTVANAFLDLPTIMTGLNEILFNNDFSQNQWNLDYYANTVKNYDERVLLYKESALSNYQRARNLYEKNFDNYKITTRYSEVSQIEALIKETYETTKAVAEAIKSTNNLIQFYKDKLKERGLRYETKVDSYLSNLNLYTSKTNTHLLSLLNIKNAIEDAQRTIVNSERLIAERTEYLAKLKTGPDEFDIRSQELIIKQRENSLLDAKEKLADYFIRAPFDGVVAKINVKKGDSVSAGTVVATLITQQKIAEISLNEVDVAKVKLGQKATLSFDAIPDLTLTGQVVEIDTLGTVSQGVVTYTVKIGFDTQDERVKAGMSVSANIIIETKSDVLLVPNSAIKSQGGVNYVEVVEGEGGGQSYSKNSRGVILKNPPRRQRIEVGAMNDEFTEIVSGLTEGEIVITKAIQISNSLNNRTPSSGGLRVPGFPGSGGGLRSGNFR